MTMADEEEEVVFLFFSLFVVALFSDQYGRVIAYLKNIFVQTSSSCPKMCILITYIVEGFCFVHCHYILTHTRKEL